MQHWSPDTYDKDATQLHREMDSWNMDTYSTPAVLLNAPEEPQKTATPQLDEEEVYAEACDVFAESSFDDFKSALGGGKGNGPQTKAMACLMSIMGNQHASRMDSAAAAFFNEKQDAEDKKHDAAFEARMAAHRAKMEAHEQQMTVKAFKSVFSGSDHEDELSRLSDEIKGAIMEAFDGGSPSAYDMGADMAMADMGMAGMANMGADMGADMANMGADMAGMADMGMAGFADMAN